MYVMRSSGFYSMPLAVYCSLSLASLLVWPHCPDWNQMRHEAIGCVARLRTLAELGERGGVERDTHGRGLMLPSKPFISPRTCLPPLTSDHMIHDALRGQEDTVRALNDVGRRT